MLLIDGNHLASRCRHTMGELRTSDGRQSGVVCGVLVGVRHAMNAGAYSWENTAVIWDGGKSEWRRSVYPEYKVRKVADAPDDFEAYIQQIDALVHGMRLVGVKQVKAKGMEADDAISVFSHHVNNLGTRPTIYSGDKDFHQLVRIANILAPDKGWITEEHVLAAWGLQNFDHLLEVRAMIGDSSDCIKGVPGIGPKRAVQIMENRPLYEFLTPTQKKWVDLAKAHSDIVQRNMEIMKLPANWEETKYTEAQVQDAEAQFNNPEQINDAAFAEFARDWDLNATLDRMFRE